ncbi:MAG TPA: helix-turn-helix domain-containing protein [Actinomycetes bacterium]|nr:helix-turn-helix domain-containing protein [Actinomycetes bacterium]
MANDRLRAAMQAAHLDIEDLARAVGVDPKTVQRWLAGRSPRPRHRWALVDLLGEQEELLWPTDGSSAVAPRQTAEIVAAYAHRVDAPLSLWSRLLFRARQQIDLLGYAMLFLPEQHPDLPTFIAEHCEVGALKVRIALMDPDCEEARRRDDLERLGGTLPARIRTTLQHFAPLRACPGVELRLVDVPLYNAVYRFDDQMLITPYLYAKHGFQHPLLHLRRLGEGGLFAAYAGQFEDLWSAARPAPQEGG